MVVESHSGGLVGRSVGRFTTSATGIHALTDAATLTERCIRQINYISVPLHGVEERFAKRDQSAYLSLESKHAFQENLKSYGGLSIHLIRNAARGPCP